MAVRPKPLAAQSRMYAKTKQWPQALTLYRTGTIPFGQQKRQAMDTRYCPAHPVSVEGGAPNPEGCTANLAVQAQVRPLSCRRRAYCLPSAGTKLGRP